MVGRRGADLGDIIFLNGKRIREVENVGTQIMVGWNKKPMQGWR